MEKLEIHKEDKKQHLFSMCFAFILAVIIMNCICSFYYDEPLWRSNLEGYTSHKYEPRAHNPYYNKEGYGNVNIDKYGFNNSVNFTKDQTKIVCMGSSQTLSIGLYTDQNYVSLLNRDNETYKAYNLGVSSCYLDNSLYRAPLIKKKFPDCKAIVIETPALPNLDALKHMEKVLLSGDIPITDYDEKDRNVFLKFMRHRPILRLISGSLSAILKNGKNNNPNKVSNSYNKLQQSEYVQLANQVFKLSRQQLGEMPVIIMYFPHYKIDREGNIDLEVVPEQEQAIKNACQANNFTYLSLGPIFVEQYNKNRIAVYGFTNSHIGLGHLNVTGNRIVADVLEKVLQEQGVFQ